MDYPISTVARLTGTTSRALRHYGDIGLLAPSRVGINGYRYYDSAALVRLQRILLLRNLGLSLPTIAEVMDATRAEAPASVLRAHLEFLRGEQERLDRQITAVLTTVEALERGEEPMPEDMFNGFDHTRYRDEVEERWGREAYAEGDAWWRGKSQEEKDAFGREATDLNADWTDAASRGIAPTSQEAVALAGRHVGWLTGIPGTPRNEDGSLPSEYVRGLGEMYVGDPRFAANYGGRQGAEFVRAALEEWLVRQD